MNETSIRGLKNPNFHMAMSQWKVLML